MIGRFVIDQKTSRLYLICTYFAFQGFDYMHVISSYETVKHSLKLDRIENKAKYFFTCFIDCRVLDTYTTYNNLIN